MKYTICVTNSEYWQEIHDLLCEASSCDHIPDREVICIDEKEHSPTRGTFELTDEEAENLKNHEKIKWVELSPIDYPDLYPKPQPATKRYKKNVKVYRSLQPAPVSSPTSEELSRVPWSIVRTGIKTSGDFWSGPTGVGTNIQPKFTDVSYSLTGKNVDIIIQDAGVLQYHPEFLDANGQSRVRDIILDGPFYIDPNYFISNGYTTTRADGRITGSEVRSKAWWTNSANRSPQFQSEGTISLSAAYTENNALGSSLDGSSGMSTGHGTACAGLSAGKNHGIAFEANIWSMPGIDDVTEGDIETNYDAMKIWHRNKPINPETGIKNPTVINGSWVYIAGFGFTTTVNYKFRGTTGTFTGDAPTTNQVTAMKNGLLDTIPGSYSTWVSSSRSNSVNTAGDELMAEGVIYVASAGNCNQRLGIGSSDPDRLNYFTDSIFGTTDPRVQFPAGTVPCNHRDWLNPLGIGFDSSKDFHPVICVGAMDDQVLSTYIEYKALYSNNGPGVDVWAPADDCLAPGSVVSNNQYADYVRFDDSRFYDCYFNGTSAAAPVATGVIALYLQANPKATSRDVKNWLKDRASVVLERTASLSSGAFLDQYQNDSTTLYWTEFFNLRGAETRVIYNPYVTDEKPSVSGVNLDGLSFTQS